MKTLKERLQDTSEANAHRPKLRVERAASTIIKMLKEDMVRAAKNGDRFSSIELTSEFNEVRGLVAEWLKEQEFAFSIERTHHARYFNDPRPATRYKITVNW